MNIDTINQEIHIICDKMLEDDHEAAHSIENALYHDFAQHIFNTGTNDQKQLAFAVLKTKNISLKRWCA